MSSSETPEKDGHSPKCRAEHGSEVVLSEAVTYTSQWETRLFGEITHIQTKTVGTNAETTKPKSIIESVRVKVEESKSKYNFSASKAKFCLLVARANHLCWAFLLISREIEIEILFSLIWLRCDSYQNLPTVH